MTKPLRSLLLLAALLFGGLMFGLAAAGSLEPFLEPILALFEKPPKTLYGPSLIPVDFDPFAPFCVGGRPQPPHDLCI